jgi:hypothetical protein
LDTIGDAESSCKKSSLLDNPYRLMPSQEWANSVTHAGVSAWEGLPLLKHKSSEEVRNAVK